MLLLLFGISPSVYAHEAPILSDTGSAFDKAPDVLNRTNPKYPESMLKGGWEATVFIKVLIDLNGNVADTKIEKISIAKSSADAESSQSIDGKEFQEAALAAVRQWKFTPAQLQGKPVSAWITIPFRFKLSTDKEVPPQLAELSTIIKRVLQGTDIEKSKECIAKKADLIYGKEQVNLLEVLNGKYPRIKLVEGNESLCLNENTHAFNENTAFVIWKSKLPKGKGERFHTIEFLNTKDYGWKIVHWHVSW
jgi:protein TonB